MKLNKEIKKIVTEILEKEKIISVSNRFYDRIPNKEGFYNDIMVDITITNLEKQRKLTNN